MSRIMFPLLRYGTDNSLLSKNEDATHMGKPSTVTAGVCLRQSHSLREIAKGVLAEGVHLDHVERTVDLVQDSTCFLPDLLTSEIILWAAAIKKPPLRNFEKMAGVASGGSRSPL